MLPLSMENNDNNRDDEVAAAVVAMVIAVRVARTSVYKILVCASCYLDTSLHFHTHTHNTESHVKKSLQNSKVV